MTRMCAAICVFFLWVSTACGGDWRPYVQSRWCQPAKLGVLARQIRGHGADHPVE